MNVDNNIKEILLEERTTGGKLNVNVDEIVPRHLKNLDVQQSRTKEKGFAGKARLHHCRGPDYSQEGT